MKFNEKQLNFFASYIQGEIGIKYTDSNFYQLENRLTSIARLLDLNSPEQLMATATKGIHGDFKALLLDTATNNETSFFRDPRFFKAISESVLSDLLETVGSQRPLKVWCAACSTGQEPLSLSILFREWMIKHPTKEFKYTIRATDYSERVLKQAKSGRYSQLEVQRGMPAPLMVKYFQQNDAKEWQVASTLQDPIEYDHINLLSNWTDAAQYDLVLCRNVLIYMTPEDKTKVIERLHVNLQPNGILALGATESLFGLSSNFDQVDCQGAVFYRKSP